MFIDTHCHLQDEKYIEMKIENLIEKAKQNNVKIMVVSGSDEKSNLEAINIANKFEEVYATVGYHPESVNNLKEEALNNLERKALNDKVVAIGEIGLDYHYDNTDKEKQKEWFIKQILLANRLNKSIVVHSRDSIEDTFNILKKYKNKNIKGVLHCYDSSYEMAVKFIELNMIFGIGGIVTYKNSVRLKEVVSKLELDKLVLETDAPYLTPEPYRGQINEPSNIPHIALKIAEIKGIELDEVMFQTTKNAIQLFDI